MSDCCKVAGCKYRYGIVNGYCRFHASRATHDPTAPSLSTPSSVSAESSSNKRPTNNDLMAKLEKMDKKFDDITALCNLLQRENLELVNSVGELSTENEALRTANEGLRADLSDLRTQQNTVFFKVDAQNQYSRHENFRAQKVKEAPPGHKEDCAQIMIDLAAKVGVPITKENIQRCHRLGKPHADNTPRAIICRLNSYPLKKKILDNRKELLPNLKDKTIPEKNALLANAVFLTEDLTPFRGKLLKYVKEWNKSSLKYDVVTSSYGKIVCKIKNVERRWKSISSTDDFLDIGIPYDEKFKKTFPEIWT